MQSAITHWDAPRWAGIILAMLAVASTTLLAFAATR
jgi:hypothetical protein